uniref:SFRICE_028817 n=1 Tax=Spodoptera frugiperda TaxID=7108 RepID=A0A2H1W4Q2_SPOFR
MYIFFEQRYGMMQVCSRCFLSPVISSVYHHSWFNCLEINSSPSHVLTTEWNTIITSTILVEVTQYTFNKDQVTSSLINLNLLNCNLQQAGELSDHRRWGPVGLMPDPELRTTYLVYRGASSKSRSRNGVNVASND